MSRGRRDFDSIYGVEYDAKSRVGKDVSKSFYVLAMTLNTLPVSESVKACVGVLAWNLGSPLTVNRSHDNRCRRQSSGCIGT